jgi:hypothetical protein
VSLFGSALAALEGEKMTATQRIFCAVGPSFDIL